MKKHILIVLLCLFFLNFAFYSLALQKDIDPYPIPVTGENTLLSDQRQNLNKIDLDALKADTLKNQKIGPVLNNFLSGSGSAWVSKTGPQKDKVRLIINTTDNKTKVNNTVSKYGARILKKRNELTAIEVPVENIEKLVNETDGIKNARLPARFFPMGETTEGLYLTGADDFHYPGHTGAGVRIAIIDVGFKGLDDAYQNGDIPYGVRTVDFTGNGMQTEYYHGTACAEIIHDMAPDAELYLMKVSDEIDIYYAIDYCIAMDIDIINFSLGAFGTGPGDGTGDMDEAFEEARANGILVVAAAGNFANFKYGAYTFGSHWEDEFYDSGDGTHEFIPGDPNSVYNVIGATPAQNDDGDPEIGEVNIMMRWNDWIGRKIDYDIYLYEYNYTRYEINYDNLIGYSNITQNGYQPPMEQIFIDLDDDEGTQYYALVVNKKDGEPAGTELEIYLGGTSSFLRFNGYLSSISTSDSSITEPADAEGVLAVGAIFYDTWESGPKEDFSSQGPTNAWAGHAARIKPDICGPDGTTTSTFGLGGFFGSSASTPHVAGAAALILSLHPGFGADELQSWLETDAVNMGEEGKDNLYGSGRMDLSLDSTIDPDQDGDGLPDTWETLYLSNTYLYDSLDDPDDDNYSNLQEFKSKTNPLDADTDDDGILDGDEDTNKNSSLDDGETFPTREDSDDDGLQDGTEQGLTTGNSGTDYSIFIPDSDPSTVTDPMNADTDGDGIKDGQEDLNHNGKVDSGETDPNDSNSTDNDTSDGGGGCFIGTAAYYSSD